MQDFRVALKGWYPPPFGGISVTTLQLANQLHKDEIPFRVFSMNKPRGGFPEYVYYCNPSLYNIFFIVNNIRKFRPDVIHTQSNQLDWQMGAIARMLGIPVIHHVHGEFFPKRFFAMSPVRRLLMRTFARTAEGIIAVSRDLGAFLESIGVDKHRIHVIPSLLPFENHVQPSTVRFGARSNYISIVSVGFNPFSDPCYGFGLVPVVAKHLHENNIPFKWYLVGQSSLQQVETFRNSLAENGVQNCVELVGELDRSQILGLFKSAHIFVRTKYNDSYGLVIAEAHQLGCHCLFGDNNPHFRDGDRLTTYRTGNADDLSAKLLELIPKVSLDKPKSVDSPFAAEAQANYEAIKQVYKLVTGKC